MRRGEAPQEVLGAVVGLLKSFQAPAASAPRRPVATPKPAESESPEQEDGSGPAPRA